AFCRSCEAWGRTHRHSNCQPEDSAICFRCGGRCATTRPYSYAFASPKVSRNRCSASLIGFFPVRVLSACVRPPEAVAGRFGSGPVGAGGGVEVPGGVVPATIDGAPDVVLGAGVDNKREGGKVSVFSGADGLAATPAAPAPGAAGLAVGAAVGAEPGVEAPAPGAPAPCAKALPLNRQTATASPVCCHVRYIAPRLRVPRTMGQPQRRVCRSQRVHASRGKPADRVLPQRRTVDRGGIGATAGPVAAPAAPEGNKPNPCSRGR